MREFIINWIKGFYTSTVNGEHLFNKELYDSHSAYWSLGMLLTLSLIFLIVWHLFRFTMIRVSHHYFDKTKTKWDDYLLKNKVFKALAYLIPLTFVDYFISIVFYDFPSGYAFFSKLTSLAIVFFLIITLNRILVTLKDILLEKDSFKDKPIHSYVQVLQIIVTIILIAAMISIVTGVKPINLLASFGAASAILILVFKDTILGFVGSIQLGGNDIVRIGDWITMEKFGADGTVEEINLTTVKVRNFDKTITTIPTYSMVSDSFQNWRGMEESDGRRIMRAIKIEINTVRYLDDTLFERLKMFKLLKNYLVEKQKEIQKYNEKHGFIEGKTLGGRKQTNIGAFREYVERYIHNHPDINQEMPIYIRQLDSTDTGLPLEIYCFTKVKDSLSYNKVQSDIFDHFFSIIHEFDLSVFEQPSGSDIQVFKRMKSMM